MASASRFLLLSAFTNVDGLWELENQGVCLLQGMTRIGTTKGMNDTLTKNDNDSKSLVMKAQGIAMVGTVKDTSATTNKNDFKESLVTKGRRIVDFEPDHWNKNVAILRSHNCYEYALNDLDSAAAHNCHKMLEKSPTNKKQCRRWFHIPGYRYHQHDLHEAVRFNRSVVSCQHLMERVARDGEGALLWAGPNNQPTTDLSGKSWKHNGQCPTGSYMASLVVEPGRRFHFYRRDHMCQNEENKGNLCWSHKPGIMNATRFDSKGQEIYNLHKADRSYGKHSYTDVCGFFCVPGNDIATTHSDFYRGGKKHRWAVV